MLNAIRGMLPNAMRREIRTGIERLPALLQAIFPAPDIRRPIRMTPERRDEIDPEWRQRAGSPAPTPADIERRIQYIELEKAFAEYSFPDLSDFELSTRIHQRAQLAALLFDSRIEGIPLSQAIYTGVHRDDTGDEEGLIGAMLARADAIRNGRNLNPLLPEHIVFGDGPDDIVSYSQLASKGHLENQYNIPADLFGFVGFAGLANAAGADPQPEITDAVYNALPVISPNPVPVSGDDPIMFEEFVNGEPLLIVVVDGHNHYYKRASLETWLNPRRGSWTNPATGLPITIQALRRGTAQVSATGGVRRRRLSTRGNKKRHGKRRQTRRRHK